MPVDEKYYMDFVVEMLQLESLFVQSVIRLLKKTTRKSAISGMDEYEYVLVLDGAMNGLLSNFF